MSLRGIISSTIDKITSLLSDDKQKAEEKKSVSTNGQVFESKPTGAADEFVYTSDSQKTAQTTNTNQTKVNTEKNIDTEALAKKYQKNPSAVLAEIGRNFTDEQKEKLKNFLKDDKRLKSFLKLVKESKLSEADIIAGINELEKDAPAEDLGLWETIKGYGKRAVNTIVKAIDEGFEEAYEYAQSEFVYNAGKTSRNMAEIREERDDLESETVAQIGHDCADNEELKEADMQIISSRKKDGTHRFHDKSIIKSHQHIKENPELTDEYISTVIEISNIEGANGTDRYDEDVIIDVSIKASKNEGVSATIKIVAHKHDMDNEGLTTITDNLCENPDMQDAIKYSATAKAPDGTDRFSAKDVTNISGYLVDKNADTCASYTNGLQRMAQNQNLSGSNIVDINNIAHDNPEQKEAVITKACTSTRSGNDTVNDCKTYIEESKSYNSPKFNTNNNSVEEKNTSDTKSNNFSTKTNITSPIKQTKTQSIQAAKTQSNEKIIDLDGKKYSRTNVLKYLERNYGNNAERILQRLEKDSSFIEIMKKHGNNKAIMEAIIKDPLIIEKLRTKISSCLTSTDLEEIIGVCKDKKSFEALSLLCNYMSPQYAVMYIKNSKRADVMVQILENTALSRKQKMDAIKQLS